MMSQLTATLSNNINDDDITEKTNKTSMDYQSSYTGSIDPVSFEVSRTVQIVFLVAGCGLISLFGVGANIINIVVFVRQGFNDSINVSLLGLAVGDLGCVITSLWSSICYNPLFADSDVPFNPGEIMYLTGGMTHACFNRITSFITAFIAIERCLCITFPLKVKHLITPFKNKIIITAIFLTMVVVFSPFYAVNKLVWRFNPRRNRTTLSLVQYGDNILVESVMFSIHSVGMSSLTLITVVVCTIILTITLNRKAKWRQTSAHVTSPETVSTKDKKVVKMVTFISVIFIACFLPGTVTFFVMAYEPEFNFGRKYNNIGVMIWAMVFLAETVNSSVNILVYYNMSSKFKAGLSRTLCVCRESEGNY